MLLVAVDFRAHIVHDYFSFHEQECSDEVCSFQNRARARLRGVLSS